MYGTYGLCYVCCMMTTIIRSMYIYCMIYCDYDMYVWLNMTHRWPGAWPMSMYLQRCIPDRWCNIWHSMTVRVWTMIWLIDWYDGTVRPDSYNHVPTVRWPDVTVSNTITLDRLIIDWLTVDWLTMVLPVCNNNLMTVPTPQQHATCHWLHHVTVNTPCVRVTTMYDCDLHVSCGRYVRTCTCRLNDEPCTVTCMYGYDSYVLCWLTM